MPYTKEVRGTVQIRTKEIRSKKFVDKFNSKLQKLVEPVSELM